MIQPTLSTDTFLPTLLLAQSIVNIHGLREISRSSLAPITSLKPLSPWYNSMVNLGTTYGFNPNDSKVSSSPRTRGLLALWHYACVARLSPINLIEEVAGRGGRPPPDDTLNEVREWICTPTARLAVLHSGRILLDTADLKDSAFLLPRLVQSSAAGANLFRAIFQATMLILCYLSMISPVKENDETLDVMQICSWQALSQICDDVSGQADTVGQAARTCPQDLASPAGQFVLGGGRRLMLEGFLDGRDHPLDFVR